MYRYVQVNEMGEVVSDSFLSSKVTAEGMILIDEYFDIVNKRYVNGRWEDYVPGGGVETLTQQEQSMLETVVNVDYLVCLADMEI